MICIQEKADCCGCSACQSVCNHNAIVMKEDLEGFKYPEINADLCVNCGLCEKVCPIQFRKAGLSNREVMSVWAARSKDDVCLKKSSSGGIFGLLVRHVISLGGVVFGAAYDESMIVRHTYATTLQESEKFYGSKYVQSDTSGVFLQVREFLKQDRLVLFSGTPCQVEGLRLFLRKDYEKLVLVDLGCHAVPSPKLFRDYVGYINKKFGKKLFSINMREKEKIGWSAARSSSLLFCDGTKIVDPPDTFSWRSVFFSRMADRPSCFHCQFSNTNRPGDLTLADFWDRGNKRPELSSSLGTSSIFINTLKGEKIFEMIRGQVVRNEILLEDALQQCFQEPTWISPQKETFWKYYKKNGFEKTYCHFFIPTFWTRVMHKLKKVLKK